MSTPSSSRALTSTSSSDPPPRSLNRQTVLDEDDYQEGLSRIIARDFFPSLVHLEASNDYLSALETQDPTLIHASVRRLVDLASAPTPTPRRGGGVTPYVNFPSDTPLRTPRPTTGESFTAQPKYDPTLSLDAFQARYTSEDNSSFTEILNDENKKRKEKYAWAWKAEDREMAKKAKEIEGRKRLLIQATSSASADAKRRRIEASGKGYTLAITDKEHQESGNGSEDEEDEVMRELEGLPPLQRVKEDVELDGEPLEDEGENSSAMVLVPSEDQPPVDVMAPLKDKRSTTIPGWKFKARNALMFGPGADDSPYDTEMQVVDTTPSVNNALKEKPSVVHANTRLPEQSESMEEPPSPTRSRIAAAISGEPYGSQDGSPTLRGFGYVDPLPTPNPADFGPEAMKQLMTWGALQGTPRILSVSGDPAEPPSPFIINAPTPRDTLGRRLGNEAGRSITKKANILAGTPVRGGGGLAGKKRDVRASGSTPMRSEMLTPAAKALLARTKAGRGMNGLATPVSSSRGLVPGSSRPRTKELDLGKVSWTPKESPRLSR